MVSDLKTFAHKGCKIATAKKKVATKLSFGHITTIFRCVWLFQKKIPFPPHPNHFSKHRASGPMLSISRNVRLSVCPSVCPSVCVFTFEVPFKRLFAPTSQSRMSNIIRDSESLGKSNGKEWSHI